jgi:pimeloyl-ACP methyl ester carboxylesterase
LLPSTVRPRPATKSRTAVVTIADAGHFTLNEKPSEIAEILLGAVKE